MSRTGTSLVLYNPSDLATISRYTPAVIEGITDLGEVIQLNRMALQELTERIDSTLVEQNLIAEIRLRAQRRAGELLRLILIHGGDRRSKNRPMSPTLQSLGISKMQSSRWQQIANLPTDVFEGYIAEIMRRGLELTTQGLLEAIRLFNKAEARQQRQEAAAEYAEAYRDQEIILADMKDVEHLLEDGAADLMFCDPVYEDVGMFETVAELAARKLKKGGICLVYSGVMRMNEVYAAFDRHLRYWWTIRLDLKGPRQLIHSRNVESCWKPIIAYHVPPMRPALEKLCDALEGGGREKELHDWQQSESEPAYLIERFTKPGELVVDLCCGSGTIPAVAKKLGRRWLGFEINPEHAANARKRVAETVVQSEKGSGRNAPVIIRKPKAKKRGKKN